jgi:hypothetical protein
MLQKALLLDWFLPCNVVLKKLRWKIKLRKPSTETKDNIKIDFDTKFSNVILIEDAYNTTSSCYMQVAPGDTSKKP